MTTKEILTENARRLARFDPRAFDPVSGRGSVGERRKVTIRRLGDYADYYLPVAMLDDPMVAALVRVGDTTDYLRQTLGRDPDEADREMLHDRFRRVRILHDFPYWAVTYAKIKQKGGGEDCEFRLNHPQRLLVEKLEVMRLAKRPIRVILLKARQWGGSTCIQLYMAWLQLVHAKGLNSLILAHQGTGTDEIKDMFDRMIESYPIELLHEPDETWSESEKKLEGVGKSRAIFRVPQRNCKIKIGSAERPDSCRGGDYNLVHCSEVGIWKATLGKTPEQMVRSACSGVLLKPLTMIVYESTANGTGNFFHREYQAARAGESQFTPFFIAWYDIEQYSAPLTDAEAFATQLIKNRYVVTSTSDRRESGKYLWMLWEKGATLEAINWYVAERSKYSEHGMMASEYPTDDVEAFVHSGQRVFDIYKIESLRQGCRVADHKGVIDDGSVASSGPGSRLKPLGTPLFTPLESGDWQIWAQPDAEILHDNRYVTVVDVGGRSLKSDWSVIVVFDRLPQLTGDKPVVVAQWRDHTDFDILARKAALAAKFYNNAILVIESNTLESRDPERNTDGDLSLFLLNQVREIYPNLYARPQSEEDIRTGAPTKYGFHTNIATKPMIIASLVSIIREGAYIERDEQCLSEYAAYERRQNGSYGAIAGCHDDLLMTRAIGLHLIFNELPPVRQRNPLAYVRKPPRELGYSDW